MLEGLQPPDGDDLFILAVLYEADGDEAKEVEVLKGLAALDDKKVKPGYLTMYAQLLTRQGKSDKGRLDEAGRLVDRLEHLEAERQASKGAFGTVELRAQLAGGAGRRRQGAGPAAGLRRPPRRPAGRRADGDGLPGPAEALRRGLRFVR